MLPSLILRIWALGLLSIGIIAGGVYFAHEWMQRSWAWDPAFAQSRFSPDFGWNEATAIFGSALALFLIALLGSTLVKAIIRAIRPARSLGDADPFTTLKPHAEERLRAPDGSELDVKCYGRREGTPIILSHGWGLDSQEWNYMIRDLAERFNLIVWDEPGLGKSSRSPKRDYSLENLARCLSRVLEKAHGAPAVLVGHSIGGMIILTFCRLFPESLRSKVCALVLTHTTPTDPVRTTAGAALLRAIEKPVLVPLMHLTVALSPLVWFMNWLSYRNGSAHLSNMRSSFGGTESWQQIEFATRFQLRASPAVVARGMLGMMRYDEIKTLPQIPVPTLVVTGDRDRLTKPEAGELIRSGVPDAKLETLAPARHLGLIEHHRRYNEVVREFAEVVSVPNASPMEPLRSPKS